MKTPQATNNGGAAPTGRGLVTVTPVILTLDEEPNIGRTLESLRWARRVVLVDSGSTDRTREIASTFPNTAWFARPWSGFGDQWRFGLKETGIDTEFALALDADMSVEPDFIDEMMEQFDATRYEGGVVSFEYRYEGRALFGSVYPEQLRLVRCSTVRSGERGHAHLLEVPGPVYRFRNRVVHDDRKPLERWVREQLRYAAQEAHRFDSGEARGVKALLRRAGVMPVVMGAYGYLRAGGPFGGAASLRYATERAIFEGLLSVNLLNRCLRDEMGPR